MKFEVIDRQSWSRKEYFEHYYSSVPCTYSMNVRLDITEIVESRHRLYPAMLYAISVIVNRHSEFRTSVNEKGEVGVFSEMIPCYTVFHKKTKLFQISGQNIIPISVNSWMHIRRIWKSMAVFCKWRQNRILQLIPFLFL